MNFSRQHHLNIGLFRRQSFGRRHCCCFALAVRVSAIRRCSNARGDRGRL
ncbi:hypothetical protein Hanom_Chr07g00580371 [Helianthus anomalus]